MKRIRHLIILITVALTDSLTAAPVRSGAVQLELVAAVTSVRPGRPFTVALRLLHDPHWHTYWINPGTGMSTSLAWKLPEGFKAEAIQWPVPQIFRDATNKVTGYGYEGEAFLLVTLTPPVNLAPGADVTLNAHASWLVCQEVCMPGETDLSLTLPVKSMEPAPDAKWSRKIVETAQRLPVSLPAGWTVRASRIGESVDLHLAVTGSTRSLATSLQFLSSDGFIDHETPQVIRTRRDGYDFRLKVAETADPKTAHLTGILRSEEDWVGDSDQKQTASSAPDGLVPSAAFTVDVPIAP